MTAIQSTEVLIMFRSNHCRRSQFMPLRLAHTIPMHKLQVVLLWICALVATVDWAAVEVQGAVDNVLFVTLMCIILACLLWTQVREIYVRV